MTTASVDINGLDGSGGQTPDDAAWLVLRLPDGSELWTSTAALRQKGLKPSAVATLIVNKFKLANPKKAKLGAATHALSVLVLPAGAIIHEGGHA